MKGHGTCFHDEMLIIHTKQICMQSKNETLFDFNYEIEVDYSAQMKSLSRIKLI